MVGSGSGGSGFDSCVCLAAVRRDCGSVDVVGRRHERSAAGEFCFTRAIVYNSCGRLGKRLHSERRAKRSDELPRGRLRRLRVSSCADETGFHDDTSEAIVDSRATTMKIFRRVPVKRRSLSEIAVAHRSAVWTACDARSSRPRSRVGACLLAVVVMVAGCDGRIVAPDTVPAGPPLPSPAAILTVAPSALTAAALAALGPDGRFTARATPFAAPFAALTGTQAESIAVRFTRAYSSVLGSDFSEDRRAPVNASRLLLCSPALYAESALAPTPDSIIVPLRIHYGPQWEVILCEDGVQKAVIAVGAFATDLIAFDFEASTGAAAIELLNAAIHFAGLPVGVRYLASAEEAASRVAATTGRRVAAIPRLVRARIPNSSIWTMWSVDLDSVIAVRGTITRRERNRSTLLYGLVIYARWEMTVADATNEELGPYVTTGEVLQPGGSLRTIPVVLSRQPAPSFAGAEPVVRLAP